MDPVIVASIITGSSTIVATIIGCFTAKSIHKSTINQKVNGNNNKTNAKIGKQ